MNVSTSSRPLLRARASRGYTAIEVMLAMTVLLIGTAGVMSMQKSSIQANLDARKLDIANSIAHDWLERITTDAMGWTLPAMNVNGANNFVNTTWLQTGWNNQAVFFLPALPSSQATAEGKSPAFDILGRDLASASPVFCVHVNIAQLAQDAQGNPNLLRATVLVFWPKQLVQSGAVPSNFCGSYFDVASAEAANPGTWHMVYASTGIRKNPLQIQ
jgi:prepilin-type N-terminal cleavage/methylation domain-containing protein